MNESKLWIERITLISWLNYRIIRKMIIYRLDWWVSDGLKMTAKLKFEGFKRQSGLSQTATCSMKVFIYFIYLFNAKRNMCQRLNPRRKKARQPLWSHLTERLLNTSSYFPCFSPVPPVFSYSLTLHVHNLNLNETYSQFGRADAEGMTPVKAYGRRRIIQKMNSYGFFFFVLLHQNSQLLLIRYAPNPVLLFFFLFFFFLAGIAFWSSNPFNGIHFACNEAAAPTSCCLACVSSWRRMQGQGLTCIRHVIISLEMDHDQNECLGLCLSCCLLRWFLTRLVSICVVFNSLLCSCWFLPQVCPFIVFNLCLPCYSQKKANSCVYAFSWTHSEQCSTSEH